MAPVKRGGQKAFIQIGRNHMSNIAKWTLSALAGLIIAAGVHGKTAWASIGLQIEPCNPSCDQTINIYGNPASNPGGTGNLNYSAVTFAIPAGLTASDLVATETNPFSITNTSAGGSVSGYIKSNVFDYNGTMLFSYQFDITKLTAGISAPNAAGISPFDLPFPTAYNLNLGVFGNSSTGAATAIDGLSIGTNSTPESVTTFFGNPTALALSSAGSGNTIFGGNNTPINVGAGEISPELFLDTNALYYTQGTMFIQSSGLTGSDPVFVPDTPEPATLLLFGTALAGLTMALLGRKVGQASGQGSGRSSGLPLGA